MTDLKKIITLWGIFDLCSFGWYFGWRLFHGQIPFYYDIAKSIASSTSFGVHGHEDGRAESHGFVKSPLIATFLAFTFTGVLSACHLCQALSPIFSTCNTHLFCYYV
jgi:hypothetical protein